jgi:chemotaxis protein MotB
MAMKKKAAAPEPAGESAPMWIVSFADLVTLLMSFFVVLYALKKDGAQEKEITAAIKATFDPSYIPAPDSPSEWDQMVRRAHGLPGPPFPNNGGKVTKPSKGAEGSQAEVETIRPGNVITTGGKITFDAGECRLDDTSKDTIAQIYDKVRGHNNVLMVKGHVSADEIALRPDDKDGWSLSYQRSLLVIDELVRMGIDRRVLRPVPCGPFEPIRTGVYDTAALRQNRRVEVFTTDYTASEYAPMQTVQATTDHAPAKQPPAAEHPPEADARPHRPAAD